MSAPERVAWINGEIVPDREATISVYDSALMFGDMVFEMTRTFNGVQFKLREHLERLFRSLKMVRIPPPMSIDEFEAVVHEVVEANAAAFAPDDEHRVMVDVTRGLLPRYHGRVGHPSGPKVIVADCPLRWAVSGMSALYELGVNMVVVSQRAIPAFLLEPKVKNRSRLHYMMAELEASQFAGERNSPLLLDPDGHVAEGSGDNVFYVKDGVAITPEPRNILEGVSRNYVLHELCPQLGVHAVERNFGVYDMLNADEAFMTATPFCIVPVTSLGGSPIGDGKPGRVTRTLLETWGANVGVDIPGQIAAWDADNDGPSALNPYAFEDESEPVAE
jgi:branched-chain amino acid aminotransferase